MTSSGRSRPGVRAERPSVMGTVLGCASKAARSARPRATARWVARRSSWGHSGRMTPNDEPTSWDERTTLLTMLQYTRDVAAARCRDLAVEHVAATPLESSPLMSIGGVVNHLRWVEHWWIESRFAGGSDLGPWTDESPDQEFVDGAGIPLAETLRAYDDQAARTDRIIADHELDDRARMSLRSGEHPTLRWILLHLIEENARHNGHLDILRELADGRTGP